MIEASPSPIPRPERVRVHPSASLRQRLRPLGANGALGLSGYPPIRMESAVTARFYRHGEHQLAFPPAVLEDDTFSISRMTRASWWRRCSMNVHLLQRHWRGAGAPLLLIPIPEAVFERAPDTVMALAEQLNHGVIDGIDVQCAPLDELAQQGQWVDLPEAPASPAVDGNSAEADIDPTRLLRDSTDLADLTAAQEQELDDISVSELCQRLWTSASLREQAEVLELLQRRLGGSLDWRDLAAPRSACRCWRRRSIAAAFSNRTGMWCAVVPACSAWCTLSWKMR